MSRIEKDGRKWLRKPKLYPKNCRAVLRTRRKGTTIFFLLFIGPCIIFVVE